MHHTKTDTADDRTPEAAPTTCPGDGYPTDVLAEIQRREPRARYDASGRFVGVEFPAPDPGDARARAAEGTKG